MISPRASEPLALTVRMISIVSVAWTGRGSGPCQPSITCGPDTPMPRWKRPCDSDCRLSADVASSAGLRDPSCTTNVPNPMVEVCAARWARPVSAS